MPRFICTKKQQRQHQKAGPAFKRISWGNEMGKEKGRGGERGE